MTPLFTSTRLHFRQFTLEDGPLIYDLNSDPAVIRYVHEPIFTQQQAAKIVATIIVPQYQKYHHGRWAVHLKENSEFIGWCGLKRIPKRNFPDLGYRFFKKHWGKGYATEAAKRIIEYGFEVLQLPGIFAAAHIENIASQKVLEKCGFTFLKEEVIDEITAKTYESINPSVVSSKA